MAYLYLFYDDFLTNEGTLPQEEIAKAKLKINERFHALKNNNPRSEKKKKVLEDIYSFSNKTYQQKVEDIIYKSEYGEILNQIDVTGNNLKYAKDQLVTYSQALVDVDSAIIALERAMDIGIQNGTITQASTELLSEIYDKANDLYDELSSLCTVKKSNTYIKDDGLLGKIKSLQNDLVGNGSGYAFEIFLTLASKTVAGYGKQEVVDKPEKMFINAGAKVLHGSINSITQEEIEKELKEDSSQSKGDLILVNEFYKETGTGKTLLTATTETVQIKNYAGLSSIALGKYAENTLGKLNSLGDNIWQYYTHSFVFNTAAALGAKVSDLNSGPINAISKNKNITIQQEQLKEAWRDLVRPLAYLSAVDAIAGNGILNGVDYYAIRNKSNAGKITFISSYEILEKIEKAIVSGKYNSLGVSQALDGASGNRRYAFTEAHKSVFQSQSSQKNLRSMLAIRKLIPLIEQTKVKISLNLMNLLN